VATQTHISRTITYRGPTVLMGALAHLLREEGVEFERPRDDRKSVAEAVDVILIARAGGTLSDRSLDDMIDVAVTRFRKRFGDDTTSVTVEDGEPSPA
jgi:hypothetical protein